MNCEDTNLADWAVDSWISQAVAKERERCAKIAEGFSDFEYRQEGCKDVCLEIASMRKLAAEIRKG
jgi:hypothetical protein